VKEEIRSLDERNVGERKVDEDVGHFYRFTVLNRNKKYSPLNIYVW